MDTFDFGSSSFFPVFPPLFICFSVLQLKTSAIDYFESGINSHLFCCFKVPLVNITCSVVKYIHNWLSRNFHKAHPWRNRILSKLQFLTRHLKSSFRWQFWTVKIPDRTGTNHVQPLTNGLLDRSTSWFMSVLSDTTESTSKYMFFELT